MNARWSVVFPLLVCVLLAGCSSSRQVMVEEFDRMEKGTYVLAVVTLDGDRIDFSSTFPGYAVLSDSTISWNPTDGSARRFSLSEMSSYEVQRFSWWKTLLFLAAIPVVTGVILYLSIRWP